MNLVSMFILTSNMTVGPRTIGSLALCPTDNAHGSHYFFSLSKGRVINWNHANPLPILANMIEIVKQILLECLLIETIDESSHQDEEDAVSFLCGRLNSPDTDDR